MSVVVLKPGVLTTLQDGGRYGSRHLGVGGSGALDAYSFAVANRLVGNTDHAAVLEITLGGPTLRFEHATRIALAGADIDAQCPSRALPGWRPIDLPKGSELRLGACRRGARAYLAVRGGWHVERVLGSTSTDLRGGFGGYAGRALRTGDVLIASDTVTEVRELRIAPWWIDPYPDLDFGSGITVHLLRGRDATLPDQALLQSTWRIAAASDRQGIRLEGPTLALRDPGECVSEPIIPGTVQLPPDGRPIVLLADAQTIGGYPCIGYVCSADLPRLAQARPGDLLRFEPMDRAMALARWQAQRQRLARIELAISRQR
jgi:biotin-dependent carboxylase-like uncharacterized protein